MYMLGIGVVLLLLRWFELWPAATLSWWWVAGPFAATSLWWHWCDASGQTQRFVATQLDREAAARKERRRRRVEVCK